MKFLRTMLAVVALLCLVAGPASARQYRQFYSLLSAYDLAATSTTYYAPNGTSGTAITDGWVGVSQAEIVQAAFTWTTKAATSLDYSFECRVRDGSTIVVESGSLTAVGTGTVIVQKHAFSDCRLGLKLTTDTGTNSVSASITTAQVE